MGVHSVVIDIQQDEDKLFVFDCFDVEWSSDNTGVVTVQQDGNIKGISVGTATITAIIKGSDKIATCEVKVIDSGVVVDSPTGDANLY
ncbi:Ig-like domain-containing protein [Clostridium saccharoperbutylacetonicum]|uniref:Ig-like domain-containing protein n=1 Tax=Clostridium saccharoperbutylacetonicum TaxID=36745 RepID=UPI0039ECF4CA